MGQSQEMVVSLRRGVTLNQVTSSGTLAQFLDCAVRLEVVDDLPTGTTARIRISPDELKKLEKLIGTKCHIVVSKNGHVDL